VSRENEKTSSKNCGGDVNWGTEAGDWYAGAGGGVVTHVVQRNRTESAERGKLGTKGDGTLGRVVTERENCRLVQRAEQHIGSEYSP